MSKQTAVEWLMPKVLGLTIELSSRRISQRTCELEILKLIEQAKEMEKKQHFQSYREGDAFLKSDSLEFKSNFEQYYNQTYGGDK